MTDLDAGRPRTVLFDLAVLVAPTGRDRQALLYYLDRDGIEIYVHSGLDRLGTRDALRQRGLLRYVDGLVYEDGSGELPSEALHIQHSEDCTYAFIAERCIAEHRRPFPLEVAVF